MEKQLQEHWSLLCLLVLGLRGLCYATETTVLMMDSRALCGDSSVHWASRQKDLVVVGRGAHDRQLFADCSVVIGAATAGDNVLQLHFDAFYVQDCGVTVVVNQSHGSDFSPDSTSYMARLGCGQGKLSVLHSQEKHYVKIGVHKEDATLQQYNFRINVTVIDKLRETGPETHVVIIVSVTVVIVVGTALWLLVKYLLHRSQRWQEHCRERNMERAIRLYNSQETPQESDYMYTALPPHDFNYRHTTGGSAHRNSHPSKHTSGRGRHHRAGDIAFVHADGHIETFRMRSSPQERRLLSGLTSVRTPVTQHPADAPMPQGRDRESDRELVAEDGGNMEELAGECPPSYEEALRMPTMHSTSPHYVNLDTPHPNTHT